MSTYKLKKGSLLLIYGYKQSLGGNGYYYRVYDFTRKHINKGIIDSGGFNSILPPVLIAEKLKQFNAPLEHIQKVLWMRRI